MSQLLLPEARGTSSCFAKNGLSLMSSSKEMVEYILSLSPQNTPHKKRTDPKVLNSHF